MQWCHRAWCLGKKLKDLMTENFNTRLEVIISHHGTYILYKPRIVKCTSQKTKTQGQKDLINHEHKPVRI